MKKIVLIFPLFVVLLVIVLLINTLRFTPAQAAVAAIAPVDVDEAAAAQRLAGAVRIPTVSQEGQPVDGQAFRNLHVYMEQTFPQAHAALRKEVVGEHSLLYTWQGSNAALKPILLLAHLDVVPADDEATAQWTHPPFAGRLADGYIWGRGTMDDKGSAFGMLEAIELLVGQNVQPERTVYLAFGHDEELSGKEGATQIASLLQARNIAPEFVLDEGFFITDGIMPGVAQPVALVGIAEKGFVSLELRVDGEGGHSSVPPPHTAIGVLSAAITKLEANPLPGGIDGVVGHMFDAVGPHMPFVQRLVFANRWLFAPIIERQLAASPTSNALLRTTTAATMIDGGVKENVLPSSASAVVNFRILPGDTSESVIEHVRAVVDDPRVQISVYGAVSEPSGVSSTVATGYQVLEQTIRQVFPDALVAPGQVVGATDSRHYAGLSPNVYRFLPQRLYAEDVERIHGVNERIAVADYAQGIQFYHQLLRNAAMTAP